MTIKENWYEKNYIIEIKISEDISVLRLKKNFNGLVSYWMKIEKERFPIPRKIFKKIQLSGKYKQLEYNEYKYVNNIFDTEVIREDIIT